MEVIHSYQKERCENCWTAPFKDTRNNQFKMSKTTLLRRFDKLENNPMENLVIFKIFGVLTFVFESGVIFISILGRHRLPLDAQAIFQLSCVYLLMTLLGIGLLQARK